MLKPQTASADSIKSRDEIVVYTSNADITDFMANGAPNGRDGGGSAPWNTYPHFAKNTGDADMDIDENLGFDPFPNVVSVAVEGETMAISVDVTGDGAEHQFGVRDYPGISNSPGFSYERCVSGTITFRYFFPTGHAAIGKYWHVGNSENDYTARPVQIVGNAWTEATIQFGKKHGGCRDKIARDGTNYRFLCIKDSGGVPLEETGTTFSGTGTFHLKDVVIVGEVPSVETNSGTIVSEGY